jgi:hypothetical protein
MGGVFCIRLVLFRRRAVQEREKGKKESFSTSYFIYLTLHRQNVIEGSINATQITQLLSSRPSPSISSFIPISFSYCPSFFFLSKHTHVLKKHTYLLKQCLFAYGAKHEELEGAEPLIQPYSPQPSIQVKPSTAVNPTIRAKCLV